MGRPVKNEAPQSAACIGELLCNWRDGIDPRAQAAQPAPDSLDVASESDYLRHLEERHRAAAGARDLCRCLRERTQDYVDAHRGDAWLAGRGARRG